MRSTARERYTQAMDDALGELRAIYRRFQASADLYDTLEELKRWREGVVAVVEKYEDGRHPATFREMVDLDSPALSGTVIENACSTYEYHLRRVMEAIPQLHVSRGYEDDVREPIERLDELVDRLNDIDRRSDSGRSTRAHDTAADGLDRWKQYAYKVIKEVVGEDEAGRFYQKRAGNSWGNPDGSLDDQFSMYHGYFQNLKDEIQKYPHQLLHKQAPPTSRAPARAGNAYADPSRIAELKNLPTTTYDTARLVRLCEELNICWHGGAHHSVAMLVRAIMDHLPPVFGVTTFAQVASNYGGSKSFKEAAAALEASARKIADGHLHTNIRRKETLPTATQVNFSALLDAVLSEVVRILK